MRVVSMGRARQEARGPATLCSVHPSPSPSSGFGQSPPSFPACRVSSEGRPPLHLLWSSQQGGGRVALRSLVPAGAPERVAGDPAFSRAPRCAQVERTRQCSCDAGFQLSSTAGDSICQGRWAVGPPPWGRRVRPVWEERRGKGLPSLPSHLQMHPACTPYGKAAQGGGGGQAC